MNFRNIRFIIYIFLVIQISFREIHSKKSKRRVRSSFKKKYDNSTQFIKHAGKRTNFNKMLACVCPGGYDYMPDLKRVKAPLRLRDYEIIHPIGKGSFSIIFLAIKTGTNKKYAIKRIQTKDNHLSIRNEIETITYCQHQFVLKLHTHFKDTQMDENGNLTEYYYLVLDFLSRKDLDESIKYYHEILNRKTDSIKCPNCNYLIDQIVVRGEYGSLTKTYVRFYMGQLIFTIWELHQRNVIHGDIKPANLMLDEYGYLKLIDFGFAKKITTNKMKDLAKVLLGGTFSYMAPEILALRTKTLDTLDYKYNPKLADIWSIGILFYFLLTNELPMDNTYVFLATNDMIKENDFPKHFNIDKIKNWQIKDILNKLLEFDYRNRVSDLKELFDHPFFYEFDWVWLENQQMAAPYVFPIPTPRKSSTCITSHSY